MTEETIETSSEKRLRDLMGEFRPSMGHDVLLSWANDVIEAWQGDAPERSGKGDFADRHFFQGFGFAVAHIARDRGDTHDARMLAEENGFKLDDFLHSDLDDYDLDPIKELFSSDEEDD